MISEEALPLNLNELNKVWYGINSNLVVVKFANMAFLHATTKAKLVSILLRDIEEDRELRVVEAVVRGEGRLYRVPF